LTPNLDHLPDGRKWAPGTARQSRSPGVEKASLSDLGCPLRVKAGELRQAHKCALKAGSR